MSVRAFFSRIFHGVPADTDAIARADAATDELHKEVERSKLVQSNFQEAVDKFLEARERHKRWHGRQQ